MKNYDIMKTYLLEKRYNNEGCLKKEVGMGIDQHKRYSHIMVIDEVGDIVEERKLYRT